MKKLDQEVTEAVVEAATGPVCPIKKAAPVLLPAVAVAGLGVLAFKLFKGRKAKQAAEVEVVKEEVNPVN